MKVTMFRALALGVSLGCLTVLVTACGPSESVPANPPKNAQPAAKKVVPATPAKPSPESPKFVPAVPHPKPVIPKATPKPVAKAAKPAKEPEHILNGSFELANAKGQALSWRSDDPRARRSTKAHTGKYSFELHPSNSRKRIRHLICVIRNGKTLLGKYITVKCAVLCKRRARIPHRTPGSPFAMNIEYKVKGKVKEFYHLYSGSRKWGEASVSGRIPADADPNSLRLFISARFTAAGPVYVDDVVLTIP